MVLGNVNMRNKTWYWYWYWCSNMCNFVIVLMSWFEKWNRSIPLEKSVGTLNFIECLILN